MNTWFINSIDTESSARATSFQRAPTVHEAMTQHVDRFIKRNDVFVTRDYLACYDLDAAARRVLADGQVCMPANSDNDWSHVIIQL